MHRAAGGEMYRAGCPALGARLLLAARQVRPHRPVADIGCDHGKLAVWLALRGGAPRVVAVDSRPLPLEKAKALVRQTGCGHVVDCRLGNGLGPLAPNEVTDVVVAGLSGETIAAVLAAAGWLRNEALRLVLVPTTRHAVLRRWLYANGFALCSEAPVAERGRCYSVMVASYTGQCVAQDALFCQVGLVPAAHSAAARQYVQTRLKDLRKQALAPMGAEEQRRHAALVQEVEACLW